MRLLYVDEDFQVYGALSHIVQHADDASIGFLVIFLDPFLLNRHDSGNELISRNLSWPDISIYKTGIIGLKGCLQGRCIDCGVAIDPPQVDVGPVSVTRWVAPTRMKAYVLDAFPGDLGGEVGRQRESLYVPPGRRRNAVRRHPGI